jgi:hypothetical protein
MLMGVSGSNMHYCVKLIDREKDTSNILNQAFNFWTLSGSTFVKRQPNFCLDKWILHNDNVPSHTALSVKTNASVGTAVT